MIIDLSKPLPNKADAADFEESGITQAALIAWLQPRAKTWTSPDEVMPENVIRMEQPAELQQEERKQAGSKDNVANFRSEKTKGPAKIPGWKDPPAEYELEQRELLDRFNSKYAVVNEGGKTLVFQEVRDTVLERDIIERITFQDFKNYHMNLKIQVGFNKEGDPIQQERGKWWLSHPKRRTYEGVVMDPTGAVHQDKWNLWKGFAIQPEAGDWTLLHAHIRDIICSKDPALFSYVMGWLARMVQQPNKQGEVGLVMRGKKGAGKSTLGKWMMRIFGQHSIQITQAKHLTGNFNAHLRDAVFVFADEAFFAGDKAGEGALKAIITEDFITVEAKHQNAVTVKNMTHIIMASNSDWVVPASEDERRYCIMDVSNDRLKDTPYFVALNAQADNGGLSAMLHALLQWDISSFNHRAIPQTEALAEQKRMSMDSLHKWWFDVLNRGYVYRSRYGAQRLTVWMQDVSNDLLMSSYQQWCGDNSVRYPETKEAMSKMLEGIGYPRRKLTGSHIIGENDAPHPETKELFNYVDRPRGFKFGDLSTVIEQFSEKTGIKIDLCEDEE